MRPNVLFSNDVTFHGLSFTDYNGRLFTWEGGLYRAIPPERVEFCHNLFAQGVIQALVAKRLFVETERTSLKLDHKHLVLQHRIIPFVAYPQEWCDAMLKDAALLQLDLCLELDHYNLTLDDAHPTNILFDGCQPLFVDFGSIDCLPVDASCGPWPPHHQFCQSFLYPLRLMSQGYGRVARWLLRDYEQAVQESDLAAYEYCPSVAFRRIRERALVSVRDSLPPTLVNWLRRGQNRMQRVLDAAQSSKHPLEARRIFLSQLRQEVSRIQLPSQSPRSSLQTKELHIEASTDQEHNLKLQTIQTLISQLQLTSLLEIGHPTRQDSCALEIASKTLSVVYLNPEEDQVRAIYEVAKQYCLPILPLILDFVSPSCDLSNAWFAPVRDRLCCDLVIALDIIDDLVFEKAIRFDTIIDRLSIFCKQWLLIEFIPCEAPHLKGNWSEGTFKLSWYTLNHFTDALKRQFQTVEMVATTPQQRVLLLCKK